MSAEENTPTQFMTQAFSTSKLIAYIKVNKSITVIYSHKKLNVKTKYKKTFSDHGMDIMMSSYGVLPGYIKQQVIKLTSTRHRNTITISA